jgi:hypothetical protein
MLGVLLSPKYPTVISNKYAAWICTLVPSIGTPAIGDIGSPGPTLMGMPYSCSAETATRGTGTNRAVKVSRRLTNIILNDLLAIPARADWLYHPSHTYPFCSWYGTIQMSIRTNSDIYIGRPGLGVVVACDIDHVHRPSLLLFQSG